LRRGKIAAIEAALIRSLSALALVLVAGCASANESDVGVETSDVVLADPETRMAARFEASRNDPAKLLDLVRRIPKGGDLHHHLSGAIYAETYLEWAAADGGFCIAPSTSLTTSCGATSAAIPSPTDPFYDELIASWSMEGFVPTAQESGHDHFFSTFQRYSAISGARYHGRSLADVMKRADSENEQYLEIMMTTSSAARSAGESLWSRLHGSAALGKSDFASFHNALRTELTNAVTGIVDDVTNSEIEARQILNCQAAAPESACAVEARYEVYISRGGSAAGVFAQMVAAHEAAIRDRRVVALNLVGPEDGIPALRSYDLHMEMLDYLHGAYAGLSPLRISLHAGELAPGHLPNGFDIRSMNHIEKAVTTAHAERIGHGVDVLLEEDPTALLADMAAKQVLVEVCLSSNDQILELKGASHPLAAYLAAGVPVALATDDQGVSRSSIALEFARAFRDQGLDYRALKSFARNSIAHSFLDTAARTKAQAELERRFGEFESAP
jgi:adenosine deaminase